MTHVTLGDDVKCRICGKALESLAHVLYGCSALAQNRYLLRHNTALQVLFFKMLRGLEQADSVPQWYSHVDSKPLC